MSCHFIHSLCTEIEDPSYASSFLAELLVVSWSEWGFFYSFYFRIEKKKIRIEHTCITVDRLTSLKRFPSLLDCEPSSLHSWCSAC